MDRNLQLGAHVQGLLSFRAFFLTGKRRVLFALLMTLLRLAAPASAAAMAQRTGDFELEMDAPWRMQPLGSFRQYGAIPIQVSIHDADQPKTAADATLQQIITVMQGYTTTQAILAYLEGPITAVLGPLRFILDWFGIEVIPHYELPPVVTLDAFDSLVIDEEINGQFVRRQTFTLLDIHEVEKTVGLWNFDAAQWGPEANDVPPARPTHLLCRRWQGDDCSAYAALRPTSEWHLTAMYTPTSPTPGRDVRLRTVLFLRVFKNGVASTQSHVRFLTVHLGETALPKFGADWAYGDLHYHSQGTDNDGESGYSYRGTLQAMSAMGLDFSFATDHASNSEQIGSARPVFSDVLVEPLLRGLRDMSPDRFDFGIDLLNGPNGANRQATSYPRSTGAGGELVASQLFLGAEVDIAPEMVPNETSSYRFCLNVPKFLKALNKHDLTPEDFWCDGGMVDTQSDGRQLLRDVQGPDHGSLLSTNFYARQHLLHLPVDGQRKSAFIASNTSRYGGGTRRLGEILDVELDQRQKGYIFLAHPFSEGSGEGVGGLGPDLIQYTQTQLDDAFDSPYVLGLQIWNEDSLSSAKANDAEPFPSPLWQDQHQPFLFPHFQKWDILQLRGLDTARTASLSWLGFDQPRRFFAAAGSDAHGDFNFRREGYFFGTEKVTDTAIGKPRNLVQVGAAAGSLISTTAGTGRPFSQAQVVDGLRSGNFALTDGPAVRVMVDVNNNGLIDASDVPMGGVHKHRLAGPFQVIVEWLSSPEFGPVAEVDLLVGVWAKGITDGMVYTRDYDFPPASNLDKTFPERATGKVFVETPNIPYWYDPNPQNALFVDPTAAEAYYGKRVVIIDPAQYPVGIGDCIRPDSNTVKMATPTGGGTTAGSDGTVVYLRPSLEKKLADLANGIFEPVPACPDGREFKNSTPPDRMFVRAEVRNETAPDSNAFCSVVPHPVLKPCVHRVAYTNPVWVNVEPCVSRLTCAVASVMGTAVSSSSTMPQLSPATLTKVSGTTLTPAATLTTTTRPILPTSTATLTATPPPKIVTSATSSRSLTTVTAR